MKNIITFCLLTITSAATFAQDAVVSVQIVSRDKVITSTIVDVGDCYKQTNTDTHSGSYQISFPITTRETGQTWLESRGEVVAGSLAVFDRLVTKDYIRQIEHNGSAWGTTVEQRENKCMEVGKSFQTNKELAEKFFQPKP